MMFFVTISFARLPSAHWITSLLYHQNNIFERTKQDKNSFEANRHGYAAFRYVLITHIQFASNKSQGKAKNVWICEPEQWVRHVHRRFKVYFYCYPMQRSRIRAQFYELTWGDGVLSSSGSHMTALRVIRIAEKMPTNRWFMRKHFVSRCN